MNRPFRFRVLLIGGLYFASSACFPIGFSSADGVASVSMGASEQVETGIQSADTIDGWAIQLDHFVVSLHELQIRSRSDYPLSGAGPVVIDLLPSTGGRGHQLMEATTAPYQAEVVSFRIGPMDGSTPHYEFPDGGANVERGFGLRIGVNSMLVTGSARKGSVVKHFRWELPSDTRYEDCRAAFPGNAVEVRIRGEYLFDIDTTTSGATLSFDAIALADIDADDVVTEAELRAAPIPNSAPWAVDPSITNLWELLTFQAGRLARVNGDTACGQITPL